MRDKNGVYQNVVPEGTARGRLTPVVCPACGNRSEVNPDAADSGAAGISYWRHATHAQTVIGLFGAEHVVADDDEENDLELLAGEGPVVTRGLHCLKCKHNWAAPGDVTDLYSVASAIGLQKIVAGLIDRDYETVAACGGDVLVGDVLVKGHCAYKVGSVRKTDTVVVVGYGEAGNGGSFPIDLDAEVRVLRPKAKSDTPAALPGDVVAYLTTNHGPTQNRFTVAGISAILDDVFTAESVTSFLNGWTAGKPCDELWGRLVLKQKESM